MTFNPSEVRTYYAARIPHLKLTSQREWRCACPIHHGTRDSFAINSENGFARCFSTCGRGWDMISLEQELTGLDFGRAKDRVYETVGRPKVAWEERDFEALYDYTDADGKVLYQVVRKRGKKFSQRRPSGNGGFAWGLGDIGPVPYRLPRVKASQFAAVVEGEKDVLTLEGIGLVATCNNGGAGNFKPELAPHFTGKDVAIFPDNDDPGRKHALLVASLLSPVAKSVKIVELPGLPAKGDVTDFVYGGGTIDSIRELYRKAQPWTPEWEFSSSLPNENDKYVRTIQQEVEASGGLTEFWDLSKLSGLLTPWTRLSRALGGGMRRGEVYVLGANQGAGKTSMALQFAMAAMRRREGVLLFSMEMGWRAIFQRMASIEAHVNLNEFHEAQYTIKRRDSEPGERAAARDKVEELMVPLAKATSELSMLPLLVSTRSCVTPDYIISETQRLKKQERIHLVIVDHMQLMGSTGKERSDYEKFTAISRAMKQVAVDIDVPVLLVSQTSRAQGKDHRQEIEVSDLRGCLDGASMVLLSNGSRKQIRNVVAGDSILGMDQTQKLVAGAVQRAWKTGWKEVYRIRTRFGREIVATENHPFLAPGGWKALADFKIGEDIGAILRATASGECSEEDAALCRFAGYMVGNGSYRKHQGISFTTPDKQVMDDFISIVKRRFSEIQFRIEQLEHHYEIDLVRVLDNGYGAPGANPVRQWLLENGMADLRFDQKRVPLFVFDKGTRGAIEFLSGYLMTDGCIKVGRAFSVCYDTTSLSLAKDTQHLLSILGVAAVVGNPTMSAASTVPMYRLSVVRQAANTFRLLSQLHLIGKNYRKAQKALARFRGKADECSYLLGLPMEYSRAISHKNWKLWRNTDRRIGRGKALEIANALQDSKIREWAESDVLWDIVTMIEPAGQMDTWDLRVPTLDSFTANGLIVHNSGAIEEDSAGVMLLYESAEDHTAAMAEGDGSRYTRGPVKCFLKLGKNRYGEQGRGFEFMHLKYCTRFDMEENNK